MSSSNVIYLAAGLAVALSLIGALVYFVLSRDEDYSRYLQWEYLRRIIMLVLAIIFGIGAVAGQNFFIGWMALMLLLGAIRGRNQPQRRQDEPDRDIIWIDPEESYEETYTEDSPLGRIDPIEPEPLDLPPAVEEFYEEEPEVPEPAESTPQFPPIQFDLSQLSLPFSSGWIIGGGLLVGLVIIGYAALAVSAASFTLFSAGMIALVIFGSIMWLLYSLLERRS